jgi:pyruvate/2-oxoglutarate dehydrogenase complex dihydrolipoamide acyltransferase (E2) component
MNDFVMPSLGADMDDGRLLEWYVKPGDPVKRGDIVALVDTDKAAIEIEIFEDGVVDELLVPAGEKVPVGTPLARIGAAGAVSGDEAAVVEELVPETLPEKVPEPVVEADEQPVVPPEEPAKTAVPSVHATPARVATEPSPRLMSRRPRKGSRPPSLKRNLNPDPNRVVSGFRLWHGVSPESSSSTSSPSRVPVLAVPLPRPTSKRRHVFPKSPYRCQKRPQ